MKTFLLTLITLVSIQSQARNIDQWIQLGIPAKTGEAEPTSQGARAAEPQENQAGANGICPIYNLTAIEKIYMALNTQNMRAWVNTENKLSEKVFTTPSAEEMYYAAVEAENMPAELYISRYTTNISQSCETSHERIRRLKIILNL